MNFILPLLLCVFSVVFAEYIPSNGDQEYGDGGWYLWIDSTGGGKATWKAGVPSIGYQGSRGSLVDVTRLGKASWQTQFQAPQWLADSGVVYDFSFYAKGNHVGQPLTAIVQGGPPNWDLKDGYDVKLDTVWKQFHFSFYSTQKGYGTSRLNFYLPDTGKYWLDEVQISQVENALDTGWYGAADARIDSLRKSNFRLQINLQGKSLAGAIVNLDLQQHEFPFGTALALSGQRDSLELWYRTTAAKYFWSGVPENQFKWPDYEGKEGSPNREALREYLDFAKQNHWTMRGHALVWGVQGYGFDQHWSIQGSCADIAHNIKNRIDRDLKEYQGKFQEYDVWNEPFHEPCLFQKCGWGLMDSAFVWAHRADPSARLFINEYDVVAAGRTETYYELIKGMLARGIPVQAIGVQCHFQTRTVIPGLIKMRLDRLASLGLPLKVTEFDLGAMNGGLQISEAEQARQFAMFFRTVYSHPAISGIMMWGFWDSKHWIQNGGMIAADGRVKPAADTVYSLWHKVWTSHVQQIADSTGLVCFRGFPGRYKLSITQGKRTWIRDVDLGRKEGETLQILNLQNPK